MLTGVLMSALLLPTSDPAVAESAEAEGRDINSVTQRYMAGQERDVFGGLYLDDAAGGVMTVLVTCDRAVHEAALRRLVANPDRLRVVKAKHSEDELLAAQDRIAAAENELSALGVAPTLTSVDVVGNRVTVGVPGAAAAAKSALARVVPLSMLHIEDGVRLDLAVCASGLECSTDSPPFDGGTDIESFDTELGAVQFCTLGFVGRSSAGGAVSVLSAGHCGPTSSTWVQQTTPIGQVNRNVFTGTTSADAMAIPVSALVARGQVKGSKGAYQTITGHERASEDYVGRATCAYGIRTKYRCGKIVSKTARVKLGGVTLTNQRIASRPCGQGDSGSPNYYRNRAQGITSFSVTRSDGKVYCGYSHISNVLSKLGLTSVASR